MIEGELPPDLAGCYLRTGELADLVHFAASSAGCDVLLLRGCACPPGALARSTLCRISMLCCCRAQPQAGAPGRLPLVRW